MSELIEVYKHEIESLKSDNLKLQTKNQSMYKKYTNMKRSNLRLKNLINKLKKPIIIENEEKIDENWDHV